MKKIRVVSLFSGIGGFEEGIKQSKINYEVVFASEIDKYARLSYSSNFGLEKLHGDITKINENEVPDHDFLVAGFPCQSFSIAGQRQGFNDTRGTLFFDILRILNVKKPKYLLLENVKNLISHDNSSTIQVILENLSNLGYSIDFTVLNASEAGLPQNRDRTFIVGILNYKTEKYLVDNRNLKVNKLKEFYNNSNFRGFNFFSNLSYNKMNLYIEDILEDKVDDKFYFDNESVRSFLINHQFYEGENKQKIIKIFDLPKVVHNDLERQRRVYSTKGISPTVLARTDSTKILVHRDGRRLIRKFTPEENFRIQGFSADFVRSIKKKGLSDAQLYKQSGNAVPPPVISGIVSLLFNTDSTNFTFIDLFSGLGGFRLALESLDCKCVFSSEIDRYARETYNINFGEYPSGDITKIDETMIPDHDILCAGFPCQPFSIAGKRLGFDDTRGTLFFDILRILKGKKPAAFILENVAGIVNHDSGRTFAVIEKSLDEVGYFFRYKLINAKNVGYPQNRNRWYCVGFRKDLIKNEQFEFSFPKVKHLEIKLNDLLESEVSDEYLISPTAQRNINYHLKKSTSEESKQYDFPVVANEIRKSKCNFRTDGISPCLTAKMGTGGNNVPVLVNQMRKFTERECLRIMGFPDSYIIKENFHQSYKQIGNSVVVPVVRELGKEIIAILSTLL